MGDCYGGAMSLKIYNTLTRSKETFVPLNPPRVSMYVCGVTVYDYCHLGHARALINFDVISRYLRYKGYQLDFVRNYTDVDDKIINRANEQKILWNEVSEKFIKAFDDDMLALGNLKPNHEPKATHHIQDMIQMIQGLIDKGFAYKAGNDIFYSVRKKSDYGKLSGKKIDELESGSRIEIHEDKKDPLDFCLWKSSKPGEPTWDSPWGPGRPGWHIECSAMSMHFLGETIDIHGGGRDLSFPHHENEIAQSEGFSSKPFARTWIHNGFVNINAQKMSKSLGNFLTIRDLLQQYHPEILRAFVLAAHYRSPLDYTEQHMQASKQSLDRWYSTLNRLLENGILVEREELDHEKKLSDKIRGLVQEFEAAMDDDFNTAKVFGLLFDLARDLNKVLDEQKKITASLSSLLFKAIENIHGVLGLFGSAPQSFLEANREEGLKKAGLKPQEIELLIQQRNEARRTKNWAEADRIRKLLADQGVQLKDHPDGTTVWSI